MKFRPKDLDHEDLTLFISLTYGLSVVNIEFLPKGEDSWCYRVVTATDSFLLQLRRIAEDTALCKFVEHVRMLHDSGFKSAVVPVETLDGCPLAQYGSYCVLLYPFIGNGNSLYDKMQSSTSLEEIPLDKVVEIIAELHSTKLSIPTRDIFENPFESRIGNNLRAINSNSESGRIRSMLQELIRENIDDILDTARYTSLLGRILAKDQDDFVLTHGDPNLANFIPGDDDRIYLVDWSSISMGAPERDLSSYIDLDWPMFWNVYKSLTGRNRCLLQRFKFYSYLWILQEIADYTSRILETDEILEQEYALDELRPYLPIPHDQINARLDFLARYAV